MQSQQGRQITDKDVINYLASQVEIDQILLEATGADDVLCSKTALAVVKAASTVVQNDVGSAAAELLSKAFNSQNTNH